MQEAIDILDALIEEMQYEDLNTRVMTRAVLRMAKGRILSL